MKIKKFPMRQIGYSFSMPHWAYLDDLVPALVNYKKEA